VRDGIFDDLVDASEQLRIIQDRLVDGNAILSELVGLTHEAAGMGQGPNRNGAVIGGHASEF